MGVSSQKSPKNIADVIHGCKNNIEGIIIKWARQSDEARVNSWTWSNLSNINLVTDCKTSRDFN